MAEKDGADEPFVGKDTDDVGAALDLGMEPFDRVCGVQFLAVLPGEAHEGEHIGLGLVHENCQLGHLGPELVGDLAPLDLRAVGVLLGEGGGDEGGDDAPTLAAGLGQQVAGEVHWGHERRGVICTFERLTIRRSEGSVSRRGQAGTIGKG